MESRKWENLPFECMVNVLGRVGLESLLVDIPFVCKSWYKASLNPLCWKHLDFPDISRYSFLHHPFIFRFRSQYRIDREISPRKFLKAVVDRSGGCATVVKLPACYAEDALTYVADKCPALKMLVVHSEQDSFMWTLSYAIPKFKNLECLEMKSDTLFKDIVTEIGAHCKNFVALSLVALSDSIRFAQALDFFRLDDGRLDSHICHEGTMAIVNSLPKIKFLTLRDVFLERENLIKILKGCVELVYLDVRGCRGFDECDMEILSLASHIPSFNCSGSRFGTLDELMSDDNHFGHDYDSDSD